MSISNKSQLIPNAAPYKVAVVGGGKIGTMILDLLLAEDDYLVTIIEGQQSQLDLIDDHPHLKKVCLNVDDHKALVAELKTHLAVLSATPFYLTTKIAEAAVAAGIHYLDLTEDVASTEHVKALAKSSKGALIPQCGLAPGFISIVSHDIAQRFESLDTIRMCVGALPQYPSNSLNYNLTWSTDGVINEYCEPCIAIVQGKETLVPPLEQLEHFSLDGITYESFNTSGGLGTLGETMAGKINNLCYQTIRYPGHRDIMKTLLQDLQLRNRRDLLKDVFENSLPATMQDVVLVFVTVSGHAGGQLFQETYANKVYSQEVNGKMHSAIQITTAGSICAVLDLLLTGKIKQTSFIRQEEIALNDFLENRFGHYYKQKNTMADAA